MLQAIYRSERGELTTNLDVNQIREKLAGGQGTLWLDMIYGNGEAEAAAAQLRDLFSFHPLALDDAFQEAHVPRIDDWQDYLYIVLHALELQTNRVLHTSELDVFLGRNFLVTVHSSPLTALERVWNQCARGERRMASGADHVLYVIADNIVSDYMRVVEGLDDEIDDAESAIFRHAKQATVARIFHIRRTLLQLRRILAPLREVMNRLARDDYAVVDEKDQVYFRDIYDHLVRLYDIVESLRDEATSAIDCYMSVTSNRINEVMRTLTVVTALFMPISFVTGFFGMNFFGEAFNEENPFSRSALFLACMVLILLIPPVMLWWMSRRGWLRSGMRGDSADSVRSDRIPTAVRSDRIHEVGQSATDPMNRVTTSPVPASAAKVHLGVPATPPQTGPG